MVVVSGEVVKVVLLDKSKEEGEVAMFEGLFRSSQ